MIKYVNDIKFTILTNFFLSTTFFVICFCRIIILEKFYKIKLSLRLISLNILIEYLQLKRLYF